MKNEIKHVRKELTILPIFECIFWAKSDQQGLAFISATLSEKYCDEINKIIVLTKWDKILKTNNKERIFGKYQIHKDPEKYSLKSPQKLW